MHEIPFPSEKFIEDYVFESINENAQCPVSGQDVDYVLRQHEITGYGVSDLIKICVRDSNIYITVLELKNEPLKEAHLSQLARYMRGIQRQLHRYQKIGYQIHIDGELAGPVRSDKDSDFVFLIGRLTDISVYKIKLSMAQGFEAERVSTSWFNSSENLSGAYPVIKDLINSGILDQVQRVKPAPRPKKTLTLVGGGYHGK